MGNIASTLPGDCAKTVPNAWKAREISFCCK